MSSVLSRIPLLPARGKVSAFEIALLCGCAGLLGIGLSPSLRDVVVLTFLFAGLACAWNIAGGYAGLISFGHAAFFAVGAYTSTILLLNFGVPPWFGMFAGADCRVRG